MNALLKNLIIFVTIFLIGCGPSFEEKQNIAKITCNLLGETRVVESVFRIQLMNEAREEVGGNPFIFSDDVIKESISYGLCEELVLDDQDYLNKLNLIKEIESVRKEEEFKRERDERIAKEEKEKKIKEEGLTKYQKAAYEELRKYKFTNPNINIEYFESVTGSINLDKTELILTASTSRNFEELYAVNLYLYSLSIDFKDPDLEDIVKKFSKDKYGIWKLSTSPSGVTSNFNYGWGIELRRQSNTVKIDFYPEYELLNKLKEKFGFIQGKFGPKINIPTNAYEVKLEIGGIDGGVRGVGGSSKNAEFDCKNFLKTCVYYSPNYYFEPYLFSVE